jgi:flagellar assembly factor FliW
MQIQSKAYGLIDIDETQVLDFPKGLLGFEEYTHWALLDSKQAPFYWLQSLDDPQLSFVILPPSFFRPDFQLELSDTDREALENPGDGDLLTFAIVTIPADHTRMSANLQGPVVVNKKKRVARQTIQASQAWKVRHFIMDELAAAGAR